jgi:hypothetical protein
MNQSPSSHRRKFLQFLGLGGASAAAARIGSTAPSSALPAHGKNEESRQGYRVTQHIEKFYKSARM